MRLTDKSVIVTGGGCGIGRAIALRFAREGAMVVVDDINEVAGRATVDDITEGGGRAVYTAASVADEEAVGELIDTAVQSFGRLDVLVNSAMCGEYAVCYNEWEPIIEIGLRAVWYTMNAAIPVMAETGGGSIVNISSVNALGGFGYPHVYAAAKAGVIGMTRSVAVEVALKGVRVNCICPGTIRTDAWDKRLAADPTAADLIASKYPVGRIGVPEDIAAAALYLAEDESSFVTGTALVVDGGLTAGQANFCPTRKAKE